GSRWETTGSTRICMRGVPKQTSAAADWNKRRFAGHATIRGRNPNNEPVTLFGLTPKGRVVVTALLTATEGDTQELTKLAARQSS
ncbi:MAG TPA: hypothetical protein PLW35_04175, partial [Verrucomicrobiota bacterium]|nr:hypothetical protein [Verrucomicrobiota bacterium]